MAIIRHLVKSSPFSGLNDNQLGMVAGCCRLREFSRGDTIYRQGSEERKFYLIIDGIVSLDDVVPDSDAWISYERQGPGELVGVSALLRVQAYSLTATCLDPTTAIEIDVEALEKVFDQDLEIGYKVMSEVAYIFYQRYEKAKTRLYNVYRELPVRLICR